MIIDVQFPGGTIFGAGNYSTVVEWDMVDELTWEEE